MQYNTIPELDYNIPVSREPGPEKAAVGYEDGAWLAGLRVSCSLRVVREDFADVCSRVYFRALIKQFMALRLVLTVLAQSRERTQDLCLPSSC